MEFWAGLRASRGHERLAFPPSRAQTRPARTATDMGEQHCQMARLLTEGL